MNSQDSTAGTARIELAFKDLPLAVYREIEAHLQQVNGVQAGLVPQTTLEFDYRHSQVGGLWIQYTEAVNPIAKQRVKQILAYYCDRFGPWVVLASEANTPII